MMGDQTTIKKERFDGVQVEILGETYEPGQPAPGEKEEWRQKLGEDREEILKFLRTGLRYWYSTDWFGSEKRKNPA